MNDSEKLNHHYCSEFKTALNEQGATIVLAIGFKNKSKELVIVATPDIPKFILKKTLQNAIQNIEASEGSLN